MEVLESIIRQEILASGSISFARFMELALYCPKIGYYERDTGVVGRAGDFYTSVSTGPLFGELLARQFVEWHAELGGGPMEIVECGAHDGQLAADILSWTRTLKPQDVRYAIVEPSPRRRAAQEERLEVFAEQVAWFASFGEMPAVVSGVIFSNELLDAMPVHLLQWRKGRWAELRVVLEGGALVLRPSELPVNIGQPDVHPGFAEVLPEGFQVELSPAASRWWQAAAAKLSRGKLLTLDYGLEGEEFLSPSRAQGTVRAFYRHHTCDDLLARPGEQDITAHVNFSEIRRAGEAAGLRTDGLIPQSTFLTKIAAGVSEWTTERVRQFQTLTHPEHLGRSFRVLVQSR